MRSSLARSICAGRGHGALGACRRGFCAAPQAVLDQREQAALRELASLQLGPSRLLDLHSNLLHFEDRGEAPELLSRIHTELGRRGLLQPDSLRRLIEQYLEGSEEPCLTALDAHLLSRYALLLEDLPKEALADFAKDATALLHKEGLELVRRKVYGDSKYPVLLVPPGSSERSATTRRRQFVTERETIHAAVREYREQQLQLQEVGRGKGGKQSVWMKWAQDIAQALSKKTSTAGRKVTCRKALDRISELNLDPQLLGIITCQTVLNALLLPIGRGNRSAETFGGVGSDDVELAGAVPFVTVVTSLGEAVELESVLRERKSPLRSKKTGMGSAHAYRSALLAQSRRSKEGWDMAAMTVPIGAALVRLLLDKALVQGAGGKMVPAFTHYMHSGSGGRRMGFLKMDQAAREQLDWESDLMSVIQPKHQPVLMEPPPWKPSKSTGGYLIHQTPFIRTPLQSTTCLGFYTPERVVQIMDGLGRTPWRINGRILALMEEAQSRDLAVAGVPPKEAPEVPMLPPGVGDLPKEERDAVVIRRVNAEKRAAELLSEWPTFGFKLQVAKNFLNADRIYFPHNVDFRGRAYPIPPHLNHIGDDVCRGLLTFADKKPLGKEGLYWLKVSLANLLGKNKISFEERVALIDESRDWIMDVAKDPLAERNIERWADADDGPWQFLARCIELAGAWESGNPEQFLSDQPIHLDGSCNGLQHYAALGRDELGAMAVNLVPSSKPQDVYSVVLGIVKEKVQKDAEKGDKRALRLHELNALQRKVVKQTVMTICYGVTRIGARDQVRNHLGDWCGEKVGPEELSKLAVYLSGLVLQSIDEVFERAMRIKAWFDEVSGILNGLGMATSWISPIGLACTQPYQKPKVIPIRTTQQTVNVTVGSTAKLQKRKQRMGFPPNFIHSLDASHMMMAAEGCRREGITFAGVHDSFWTHACDAPVLNKVIRSSFVHLHSQPILEDLYESLSVRLGGRALPPLPEQGSLDISKVLDSPYVFA